MEKNSILENQQVIFRIHPSGRVLENRFPGIAVPPVGENLLDRVPDFLRPQDQFNHEHVLKGGALKGLMHLARKGKQSRMRAADPVHEAAHLWVDKWPQDEVTVIGHQLKTQKMNLVNVKPFMKDSIEASQS